MTSLAIVFKNGKVLKTIGDWMHSSGVDSPAVHYIASDIIKDLKTDENPEKYAHLPHTAFLFTSIILIAIGKTYNKQGELAFLPGVHAYNFMEIDEMRNMLQFMLLYYCEHINQ